MKEIILHCRSKDCEKITQGTVNSHIQVVLPEAIIPKTNETINVKLASAEIPYSWHNVSDNLDKNYITYNSIETIQLGSKNYTATELIKFLNSLTEQPFSFSYDLFTGRVTITNNDDADHTINFGVGNIRSVLGAKNQDELIQAGTSKELESLLDLVSVHAVYVKTSLASGNVMSTNTTNSTTLQKIQVENNSGSIIYLDLTSFITVSELQSHVIDTFDIQLCDQNNRLIDLNLVDWEATLVFEIVEGEPTEVEIQTAQPAQPLEPVEISEDDLAEIEMDNLIDKLRDESGLNDDEVEDENNIIDII